MRSAETCKNTMKRLFVGGIKPSVTERELFGIFSDYGNVRSAYVINDANGQSRGFGFVDFYDQEGAENALACSKNIKINGKKLSVKKFMKEPSESDQSKTDFDNPFTPQKSENRQGNKHKQ